MNPSFLLTKIKNFVTMRLEIRRYEITMIKTLAIDASSKSTGVAIFQDSKLIHYECITATSSDTYKRIETMVQKLRQLYDQYQPVNIIMEQVLPQDVKHNQNVYKTLIYLQAAIVLELHKSNAKIDFSTASHWRSVCGIRTGAGIKRDTLKAASQSLVKSVYNIDVNDDISDAICLGMAYIIQHKNAF